MGSSREKQARHIPLSPWIFCGKKTTFVGGGDIPNINTQKLNCFKILIS
jgi:hypothetical protein